MVSLSTDYKEDIGSREHYHLMRFDGDTISDLVSEELVATLDLVNYD